MLNIGPGDHTVHRWHLTMDDLKGPCAGRIGDIRMRFGGMGRDFGHLGGLGTVNVWLASLPAGYGYRYWVDGNGDNQLILYQDASGNYFALYAPLS
jgi:hypothetical protein